MYLAVVDLDLKGPNLTEEAKAKGTEILKEFPTTQTQKTVNNGTHKIYWSRSKPKTDGTFHDTIALELLGTKKVCLMAPSMGYTPLNDNTPTEVENIEDLFYDILRKHGYKLSEETEKQNQLDNYSFQLEKLVDLTRLNKIGTDEYQGPHPFHDSTTEKNFHLNIRTNQWFCFRHNSGGGALQYLAMKEGVILCEQAKKGALRGAKFKQILQVAVAQGLIDEKIITQSEINPIILAKDIKEDYNFIVDKESDILYYYDKSNGVYSDKTEQLIKREIVKRLDENTKTRYYIEIENFITHSSPIVNITTTPELIATTNGILNISTRELTPYNQRFYITQKINAKYDPEAKCPTITKFLEDILPEEKQRKIIQEYVGYSLYRKITHHICLLFVGAGRNGKSKLLELITTLLGKDNITNQTIQSLCYNRFSLAELHHKLANISADLPSKELVNTGIFKMIVGGDRLPGEHKHKDPFYFDNYAKLMFSCNRIPPIPDTEACLAFYARFKILEFKNTFTGTKADKRIIEKLTTQNELSGFLNYTLDGLKRLEEQKDFTEEKTQEETEKTYIKLSNSAHAFITEKITVTDEYDDLVHDDTLYRAFISYCHTEKIQTLPKAAFTKAMQEYCNGAERTRISVSHGEGKYTKLQAWRFIRLSNIGQNGQIGHTSETILGSFTDKNMNDIEKIVSEPCPNSLNCPMEESNNVRPEHTCAECKLWRKGGCSFPGSPDCVLPTNKYATDCRDFMAQTSQTEENPPT